MKEKYKLEQPVYSKDGGWYVAVENNCVLYLRPSGEVLVSTGWSEKENVGFWNTYKEALEAKKKYESEDSGNKGCDFKKEIESKGRGNGGKTSYYELPENAKDLGDLIYHKKMNHSIGEAFCALYRLKDNGEYERNIRKAKYYIDLELSRMDG